MGELWYLPSAEGDPEAEAEHSVAARLGLGHSMIRPAELDALVVRYGLPAMRSYVVEADDYIYSYRWSGESDRRAEVVFAIEDPSGRIWVHAKPHYPAHIFRLPTGGVHWEERVADALFREIDEEMGLAVTSLRFVGLIEYRFVRGATSMPFASYVFHLRSSGGEPTVQEGEPISEFRAVSPAQLLQIAADLRGLGGDRRGWGQWRALAHELVYHVLTG